MRIGRTYHKPISMVSGQGAVPPAAWHCELQIDRHNFGNRKFGYRTVGEFSIKIFSGDCFAVNSVSYADSSHSWLMTVTFKL